MAARSIWNGNLVLGPASLPVKLYSAIEDRKVRFHLLQDGSRERVQQRYVESGTEDAVETPKLQKAYEVEPEVYVVVNEEELASIEPPPSRDIEVISFSGVGEIGPEMYERPYYIGPNGNEDAYFALGHVL
jgi:DNA end-binding protein Ku